MCDVISLGELLVDFTPAYLCDNDKLLFEQNPGGAPANVAVQISRLGISSGFIGKVGNDLFGKFLKKTLESYNVCTKGLVLDNDFLTTLTFVQLDENGDRSFTFYREKGADTQLTFHEIDLNLIANCKVLHFGSLSLTNNPMRSTTINALEYAKNNNKIISYDPNWRPSLWQSERDGIEAMKLGLSFCDIIKVSDQELAMITGCNEISKGITKLLNMGIQVVLVTLGPDGCCIGTTEKICHLNTYNVNVIDTTGSGDSFLGAFLFKVLQYGKPLDKIGISQFINFADFANAAGALCASKTGSIPALPDINEIQYCLENIPKKASRS